ncbi:MAG: hypothetical protein WKF43_02455 [Acidimicrobiales bacterium]
MAPTPEIHMAIMASMMGGSGPHPQAEDGEALVHLGPEVRREHTKVVAGDKAGGGHARGACP